MRLEGRVTLLAEVLPNGRAGKVLIESSSGHDLLDQSAFQTVKQWQFTPAKKDGVITTQVVRIPINFNLKSR
jgi:protein TonB